MGKKRPKRDHVNKYAENSKAGSVALALDAQDRKDERGGNRTYCSASGRSMTRLEVQTCSYLSGKTCGYYTFARPCSAIRR